jgi:hypothetical protein
VAAFCSPHFEIARVLVRVDHIASFIVNTNHGIMGATEKLRVFDSVIRLGVPQPTEWQRIGN